MTDYTPGPWHYAKTKGPWSLVAFAGDDPIAGVAASDNHEANARLIAAAPDLLAALEALLTSTARTEEDAINAAFAAIAKARGEA